MVELKTKKVNLVDVSDWDTFVESHYGRIYHLQQQDGCKPRGTVKVTVPSTWAEDYENDTVPEIVNHEEMGVSFKAWLERDPDKLIPKECEYSTSQFDLEIWWKRNFYPELHTLVNDLHAKGLLEAGDYIIDIDW